ncbi:MAG: nucleotidyltransferase domain-containing protein [Clostridia bacterium]|mgnify:CR=1 FL=1|nr:nucleotidyltransferase domain-containing protein [Clostridia bacterium]
MERNTKTIGTAEHVYTIEEIRIIVSEIAKLYGVERVTLFGSYARGEARYDSDIDLRIDKGRIRGLFQLSGFHLDLEEKLKTHVDVIVTDSLNDKFLERISREEILLYEQ